MQTHEQQSGGLVDALQHSAAVVHCNWQKSARKSDISPQVSQSRARVVDVGEGRTFL